MNDDNFYSVERLVEFGLGAAVAQRMVHSMNAAISNVTMPGYGPLVNTAAARSFWVMLDGAPTGGFDEADMMKLIAAGKVGKSSHVWRPGMAQWQTVENTADVLRLVALAPPPFNPPE